MRPSKVKKFAILLSCNLLLSLACKSTTADHSHLRGDIPGPSTSFSLPGYKDDIFVITSNGGAIIGSKLQGTIYHLGETIAKTPIAYDFGEILEKGTYLAKSKFGKVFYSDGNGTLAVFNGHTGELESRFAWKGDLADFEIKNAEEIYVGYRNKALVERIEVKSGKVLSSIALTGKGDSEASSADRLHLFGNYLFVGLTDKKQGGNTNLYVLDDAKQEVVKRIDLSGTFIQDETDPEQIHLWGPLFVPAYESVRGRLLLVGNNKRPRAGKGLWLDPVKLELDKDVFDPGTFAGQVVFSKANKVFKLGHTSTPTASTHFETFKVNKDGTWEPWGDHLFDFFVHRDDISVNGSETLISLPNDCNGGVCLTGEGINFIDYARGKKLPQFSTQEIGQTPLTSIFVLD